MAGGIKPNERHVLLPWPPKELNPNFKRRKHWTQYQPQTKAYRARCFSETLSQLGYRPSGGKIVAVVFYPPDRRKRDDDGIIGQFKAGRDGVADALRVDDHTFKPTYQFGDPVKGGAIIVSVMP